MRRYIVLAMVFGCADEPDTVVVNRGTGCAYAWPAGIDRDFDDWASVAYEIEGPLESRRAFAVNVPILVKVGTLASPCATNIDATCSVERTGDTLVVTNRASWDEPTPEALAGCPREIPPAAVAVCSAGELDAAAYTLRFAGEVASVAVPGEWSTLACFRAH